MLKYKIKILNSINNLKKNFFLSKRLISSLFGPNNENIAMLFKDLSGVNSWFWYIVNNFSTFNISPVKGTPNGWQIYFRITLFSHEKFLLEFINCLFGNIGTIFVSRYTCELTFNQQTGLKAIIKFFMQHPTNLNEATYECAKIMRDALTNYTANPKRVASLPKAQKELQSLQEYKKGRFSHLSKKPE